MTLHVHKYFLDCIDDSAVVKDFVACNEVRKDIFGKGLNCRLRWTPNDQNAFSFRGASLTLTRGSASGPRWGLCSQTPVIGSCSAFAMVPPTTDPFRLLCVQHDRRDARNALRGFTCGS